MSTTSRFHDTFTRRALFGTALAAGAAALPGPGLRAQAAARDRQDRLDAARPLTIRSVEALVIRNPPKPVPFDEPLELPPAGDLTGGVGIWNMRSRSGEASLLTACSIATSSVCARY